jgi:hypothetical protein
MSSILRRFRYFQTVTAGAIATTTVANPSTAVTVNMAAATGVQTIVLPSSNNYAGEECNVRVIGAVAVQTVVVQSPSGTTIDTFAASTNGARSYVFNGTAYQASGTPA